MALGALGIILWFVMNNSIGSFMTEHEIQDSADLTKDPELFNQVAPMLTPLFYLTIIVFVAVLLVTLISIVSSLLTKPGALKKVLVPTSVFILILVVGYILASGTNVDLKPLVEKGLEVTESTSKSVGAGLISFYILLVVAIGSMIWSGVKKSFS